VAERLVGGGVFVLASLLGIGCGVLDLPDHVRAHRARARIQKGVVLPTVFDELVQVRATGDWPGLLAGFACNFDGEKRTWVLSRVGSGYVVIIHLEDTPFAGQGDWKEAEFADSTAVHGFLGQAASGTCNNYQVNFGRWVFGLSLAARNQRVREVRQLEYQAGD
jgi:hypothetical protein